MSLISLENQTAVLAESEDELAPRQTGSVAPTADEADGSGNLESAATRLPAQRIELSPERREAIAAIRARAQEESATGPQSYPNVFETPSLGETAPKSAEEVERIEEEVEGQAVAAERSIDEDDPSAYEDRYRWLWGLGETHVESTKAQIRASGN